MENSSSANNGDKKPEPVIIVVKKKAGHGRHYGGAWKVAYADFVTAMMALFIVLWLLSSSEKVQKAVGGYFRDPTGNGKMIGSTRAGSGEAYVASKDDMTDLKRKIERAMSREVHNFEKLKDFVQLNVTEEGLRIELLESEKGMFFELGRAFPTPEGREIIGMLAKQLGELPNPVVIEGHTDSKPYSRTDGEYSNWELSSDRANGVRRLMHSHGLRRDQVAQVRGFADQKLRRPDDPTHASNRRISVLVRFADAPPDIARNPESAKPEGGKTSGKQPLTVARHTNS